MKALLARLWPKSLYAQLLAAAALALLIAQIINAAMLLNGLRNRAELEAATFVVGSVMARGGIDGAERPKNGRDRGARLRRRPVSYAIGNKPISPGSFQPNRELSERAAGFLGLLADDRAGPVIAIGPTVNLPENLRRRAMDRPIVRRLLREGRPAPERTLVFSLQRADGNWINAWTLIRPIERGSVFVLLVQTLLLYLIVLLALALVARRISRPLSRLKSGMADFGKSGNAAMLVEEGPSDIRELVAAYNAMQGRLGALLSEKDVMLGAIGHDLKTPLASLRVRVETVDDDAERDQMVASIDEMKAILDDILTLARMGKSGEAEQLTDIASLVETVLDDFQGQSDKLELALPSKPVRVNLRPMLIRRALRNLVSNALRYGDSAKIHLETDAEAVSIFVDDSGAGIVEEDIEAMFEPFNRAEASRNKASGGSGLGLTIARAIARAHGGDVVLTNREEGGLRAALKLPV